MLSMCMKSAACKEIDTSLVIYSNGDSEENCFYLLSGDSADIGFGHLSKDLRSDAME